MVKPAWSWQFDPRVLKDVGALPLPERITRGWAWDGADGAGVRVAIIDSGVESGHPDVGPVDGAVAVEFDPAIDGAPRIVEGPHDDLFGHGTACAGVIRKLAPASEIHSVRVLGAGLSAHEDAFVTGLRWAIDQKMDVINLSLGTATQRYYSVFHELADLAYFNRVVLVAAMANVTGPCYPGQYASVVSVAAHDGTDPYQFQCNPRPPVEFGAPGINVELAWKGGGRIRATGNSFAAPHVSGLIALILSKHPGLTPFEIKAILRSTAANAA
jgi:subtilisin family serine protease